MKLVSAGPYFCLFLLILLIQNFTEMLKWKERANKTTFQYFLSSFLVYTCLVGAEDY